LFVFYVNSLSTWSWARPCGYNRTVGFLAFLYPTYIVVVYDCI